MSKRWIILVLVLGIAVCLPPKMSAQTLSDAVTTLRCYLQNSTACTDHVLDTQINMLDFAWIINNLTAPSTTPVPTTSPPSPTSASWTQLAGNAQRTGYTTEQPSDTWTFKWHWQPDNMNTMPRTSHAIVGNGNIYLPGGNQGIYAINIQTGATAYHYQGAIFNSAGVVDPATGQIYFASTNGQIYKFNPNLTISGSYSGGGSFELAVLLNGNYVYGVDKNGVLHKVDKNSMQRVWTYSSNSPSETPPSFSASRNIIIFGTQDLYTHAVNDSTGTQKWRVKPTTLPSVAEDSCSPYTYANGWPVVSETAGVVLMRIRLGDQHEWLYGPGLRAIFPVGNSAIRSWLEADAKRLALFPLSLDTGQKVFTPAVGNGGVDGDSFPCPISTTMSTIGQMPVIKNIGGKDIAYLIFRSGDANSADYPYIDHRLDSHMGEMVLDNLTLPGYQAGDVRFIHMSASSLKNAIISDEQTSMSMAGDTIFYAHWAGSDSAKVINRNPSLGSTWSNPITTFQYPTVIRRLDPNGAQRNDSTHWTTSGLITFCDGRTWPDSSGWWIYWNQMDPPTPQDCSSYHDGMRPRYTFVSSGYVFVVGNGGDIFALKY